MQTKPTRTLEILAAAVTACATLFATTGAAEAPTPTSASAAPEVLASLSAKLALHPGLALKIAGIHNNPTAPLVKAKRAEPLDGCTSGLAEAPTAGQPASPSAVTAVPRPAFSVHTWLAAAAQWFPKASMASTTKKKAAITAAELAQQKATATGVYAPVQPAKAFVP